MFPNRFQVQPTVTSGKIHHFGASDKLVKAGASEVKRKIEATMTIGMTVTIDITPPRLFGCLKRFDQVKHLLFVKIAHIDMNVQTATTIKTRTNLVIDFFDCFESSVPLHEGADNLHSAYAAIMVDTPLFGGVIIVARIGFNLNTVPTGAFDSIESTGSNRSTGVSGATLLRDTILTKAIAVVFVAITVVKDAVATHTSEVIGLIATLA